MKTIIEIVITLAPFAALFAAFLVLKLDALRASLTAFVVELAAIFFYYHISPLRSLEASSWGILTMWSGFLVLYTGQLFGQAYRATGLLQVLLTSVQSILPQEDTEGRSLALVAVVGGFISTFNGFATYPVTVPGLVELGFDGVHAATSYLVYFAWTLPYDSLFIAPTISNAASHAPIEEIVRSAGLLSIPLVFISFWGFLRLLNFRLRDPRIQFLFWSMSLANVVGLILFTQVWPKYYLLMLAAGSALSLAVLYAYGWHAKRQAAMSVAGAARPAPPPSEKGSILFRAYAPLAVGIAIVLLTLVPSVKAMMEPLRFSVSAFHYRPISIGILTSPGFFLFVTALVCYLFRCKPANPIRDFAIASRRSWRSLGTLAIGSATVYLMAESGQIIFLGKVLIGGGAVVYTALYPFVAFLGGIAFGQGLPGDFLFSRMQVAIAPVLHIPLTVLLGIVVVATMGPSNALKPTQISYIAGLAAVKGKDGEIFRICLPWQLLQILVTAICAVALVFA